MKCHRLKKQRFGLGLCEKERSLPGRSLTSCCRDFGSPPDLVEPRQLAHVCFLLNLRRNGVLVSAK